MIHPWWLVINLMFLNRGLVNWNRRFCKLKLKNPWRWILKPQELRCTHSSDPEVKQRDKWFWRLRWSSKFGQWKWIGPLLLSWRTNLVDISVNLDSYTALFESLIYDWWSLMMMSCSGLFCSFMEIGDETYSSAMFCLMLKSKWNTIRRFLSAWEGITEAEWSPGGALALRWILVSGTGGLAWWLGFGLLKIKLNEPRPATGIKTSNSLAQVIWIWLL